MNAVNFCIPSQAVIFAAYCKTLPIIEEDCKLLGVLAERVVCCIGVASEEVTRVVSTVDGLSAIVRLAAAVGVFANEVFLRIFNCSAGLICLSDNGFSALTDASRAFRVPSYFFGKGISDDISKRRYLCIVAKVVQSVCDIGNFVLWNDSKGLSIQAKLSAVVARTTCLRWMMILPFRSCLSGLSVLSYFCVGVDKGVEVAYGNRNPAIVIDTISSFAEVAVGVLLLLPGVPLLPIACLELVAAGTGLLSNFVGAEV